jgi:tetratricopeptide (TPR) repeat protein
MRARLLLLAAVLAAFGASLGSGFHFDDYAIFSDPALGSSAGWREVWTLRQTRPLTYLTFWLNRQTGGANPLGYHALNLALHLAAVLLAYECLRRLLPSAPALIAALVFAIHPLQAEAVDYVWARGILLAAVFCFGAFLAWIAGRRWLAVALFVLALLAKEECAAFPLMLLLFDRKHVSQTAAMLAASLAAGLRVIYALSITAGAPAGSQAGVTPCHYLLAQGPVVWRYLRLFVAPIGFTVDPDIAIPPFWLGLASWAALAAALYLVSRRWPDPARWIAAAIVLLLPSSSIFPAADLAVDRRMYLPMLGLAAAAGWALSRVKPQALAATVVIALTAVTFARTRVWLSDESLWREAVERAPNKIRPKIQLARAVAPPEALALLADARRLAPGDPEISTETGRVLLAQGNAAAALAQFGRALALAPREARNYNNRGVALLALGQTDAARQDFRRALQLDPALTEARENLQKAR